MSPATAHEWIATGVITGPCELAMKSAGFILSSPSAALRRAEERNQAACFGFHHSGRNTSSLDTIAPRSSVTVTNHIVASLGGAFATM